MARFSVFLYVVLKIRCARKHGTCFFTFGVCCFQDGGLQGIALFDKERAVIDKQRPHNKTGKVTGAEMGLVQVL